jgi:uncharacterized membrane protein YraQ (UPF0718 family)
VSGEFMLAASIAALFVGPVLHRLADREGRTFSLLDGFVVVAVLGLAMLEIIPSGIEHAGWIAVLAAGAGLLLPTVAERYFGGKPTHRAAAWAAFVGMGLHAFTDGLALVGSDSHGDSHALGWAVVLHQVPAGLAVWWMLTSPGEARQRQGLVALTMIAGATVLGFVFGETTTLLHDSGIVGVFEAFVGGLLLHVVSHGIGGKASRRAAEHRVVTGIGGLLGLAVVLGLFMASAAEDARREATIDTFGLLLLESAPALLLAYGVAGLLGVFMGDAPARWLRRGGVGVQSLRGVAFGLPLPLCSCGVVPVYRSLVNKRVPATAALAFLVATPEIGLDAVLLSFPLLGLEMTLLRVGVSFVLALAVGVVVGGWVERRANAMKDASVPAPEVEVASGDPLPLSSKLAAAVRTGYGEILDSTGPWILVGLMLAAFLQPWIDTEALTRLDPALQVAAFGLVGLPVYVCATGATPLIAVLIAKGLSPGAALAFLLTGPATNATTFGVLEQLHGRKVALMFTGTVITVVLGLGWGVNALWPTAGVGAGQLHEHHEASLLSLGSAVVLGGLFIVSLLRQGPRGFLGRLWELGGHSHPAEHDGHAHAGHDHAGHDHAGHDHAHDGHDHGHDEHDHAHGEHAQEHHAHEAKPPSCGGCSH